MATPQGINVPLEISKTRGSPVIAMGPAFFNSSIRMILTTIPGERPFRPNFGCWLPIMLFANLTEGAAIRAAGEARRALREQEPRISVQDILFEIEDTKIILTIIYSPNGQATAYRSTVEFRT